MARGSRDVWKPFGITNTLDSGLLPESDTKEKGTHILRVFCFTPPNLSSVHLTKKKNMKSYPGPKELLILDSALKKKLCGVIKCAKLTLLKSTLKFMFLWVLDFVNKI